MDVTLRTEGGFSPKDNMIVTVTSLAPEKLLLSRTSATTGSATLAIPYSAGASSSQTFYLQALTGDGPAPLRITAAGYAESTVNITLSPVSVAWLNVTKSSPVLKLRTGQEHSAWAGIEATARAISNVGLRPGVPELTVPISVGDASIIALTPGTLTLRTGESQQGFQLRALSQGTTTVSLPVPPGFTAPSLSPNVVRVEVAGRQFLSGCGSGGTRAGKDTMAVCSISAQPGVAVKAVSSDPSRLTVSFDVRTAGTAEAILTPESGSFSLYLHALAGDGSARVTLSAPGYEDLTIPVELAPSLFVLRNALDSNSPSPLSVGASMELPIDLRVPESRGTGSSLGLLRPGAGPIRVDLTSTDPSVAALSASSVTFEAGDSSKSVRLNGVKAGSTVVRIATPGGFSAPSRDAVLFTVVP